MPRFLMKLSDGRYVEWSTVVDAPVTFSMSDEELKDWHLREFGKREHELNFAGRMQRLITYGTSLRTPSSARDEAFGNRAGPNESELPYDELASAYHPNKKQA